MSKLRMSVSRLLALGGLTAATGSTYAFYKYAQSGGENPSVAECRRPTPPANYGSKETEPMNEESRKWDDNWDFRKPDFYKKESPVVPVVVEKEKINDVTPKKPTATRHVILVRHGQYNMNTDDADLKTLTELGRKQAAVTRDRLQSLDKKFDRLIVSTMVRAQETASVIKERFPDVTQTDCSLLREGDPYPVEPKSKNWDPNRAQQLFKDNPRIEAAFRKYIHRASPSQKEDSYDLLVCHGNVIRYFVCRALQFPPEGWLRMSIANCGITWLTIRPSGNVSLRSMGDAGHLPPDFVTFN